MSERCLLDRAWRKMKSRCDNKSDISYPRYGGRGISYCKEWESRNNFKKDMSGSFSKGLSLDRINNDDIYCKSNCKWSTKKEQANNRRNNRIFTINGITMTLAQWIDSCGIKSSTVRQRFYCCKWSIERSLGLEEYFGRQNYYHK